MYRKLTRLEAAAAIENISVEADSPRNLLFEEKEPDDVIKFTAAVRIQKIIMSMETIVTSAS